MNNLSVTIIEEHSHGRGTPPHCAGSPPPAHTPSVAATGARARGSAGAMAAAAPGPSVRLRFRGATLALALPEGGCDAAALRAAVEDATGVCGMRPTRRARWHAAGAVLARARRPRCLLVPSTATRASPPDIRRRCAPLPRRPGRLAEAHHQGQGAARRGGADAQGAPRAPRRQKGARRCCCKNARCPLTAAHPQAGQVLMLSGVVESEAQAMALEHKAASRVRGRGGALGGGSASGRVGGAAAAREASRSAAG